MEPQNSFLKLKDIVSRGVLNLSTTRYVLSRPDALPGMPEAGSRGMQREFSLRQATLLAMASHLVRAGFSVEQAGMIAQRAVKKAKVAGIYTIKPKTDNSHLFSRHANEYRHIWILTIINEKLANLTMMSIDSLSNTGFDRILIPDRLTEDDFYDIDTGDTVCKIPGVFLTWFQMDVNALERKLAAGIQNGS